MYVIGYKYQRECLRTSSIYLIIEDVDGKDIRHEITLESDSWTNKNPETLYTKSKLLEELPNVVLSKLVAHRTTCWVKKKCFISKEDAEKYGKELWKRVDHLYTEKTLNEFKEEIFG